MARVRVHNLSVSLDGYVAGPDQGPEHPLGVGGEQLHEWLFATPTGDFIGADRGAGGLDAAMARRSADGIGATIMGRNMFGPVRGEWGDEEWRGWWGDDPPFHHPVFVLTHYPHEPIEMTGGTTFHFTADPLTGVVARAREAAGGADVLVGGGASVVRQFMAAGLIDELHVAVVPVLLGRGEPLFAPGDEVAARYAVVEHVASPAVTHMRLTRRE